MTKQAQWEMRKAAALENFLDLFPGVIKLAAKEIPNLNNSRIRHIGPKEDLLGGVSPNPSGGFSNAARYIGDSRSGTDMITRFLNANRGTNLQRAPESSTNYASRDRGYSPDFNGPGYNANPVAILQKTDPGIARLLSQIMLGRGTPPPDPYNRNY